MKRFLLVILLISFFTTPVFGAMSISIDDKTIPRRAGWSKSIRILHWTITSTTGTGTGSGGKASNVTGTVMQLIAKPDGTSQPDDDYDIDFNSSITGHDALNGAGDDLPQAYASDENRRYPADWLNSGPIFLADENISLSVTNFNAAGTARSDIYLIILLP